MPEPTTIASNVVCSLTSAPEPPRLRVSLERVLHDWALHEQVPDTRGIHPESFRSAIRLSLPPPRCNKQSKSGAEAWDKNSNCANIHAATATARKMRMPSSHPSSCPRGRREGSPVALERNRQTLCRTSSS